MFELVATILVLASNPPTSGPAFIKVEVVEARRCPGDECDSAGPLRAGERGDVMEVSEGWAKFRIGMLAGWVPVETLAAGVPEEMVVTEPVTVRKCAKPDCEAVGTAKAGDAVLVLERDGDKALVRIGDLYGHLTSFAGIGSAASAAPTYTPPAEPPKYIAPAEKPQYIAPSEPPRYIPAAAPPIYIPPAQPASRVVGKEKEVVVEGVRFVRAKELAILADPKDDAKAVQSMPGGAKLYVRISQDGWSQVATAKGSGVPALGWVRDESLRDLPPLVYRVKTDELKFRPCLEKKKDCAAQVLEEIKKGDALVSIDSSDDGAMLLMLLPGNAAGTGWIEQSAVDPG